jgi:hypothetical protein
MPLQKFDLLEIPKAYDADTAYGKLEDMLASKGISLFLVKQAAEIGFNINSRRGAAIIAAAGFVTQRTITTVYGGSSPERPPSLHHDADGSVRRCTVRSVHDHRTTAGSSQALFVSMTSHPRIFLDAFADIANACFETEVFKEPAYSERIETGDEVVFVGNGPGHVAHQFPSLPDEASHRIAELTFIDRQNTRI